MQYVNKYGLVPVSRHPQTYAEGRAAASNTVQSVTVDPDSRYCLSCDKNVTSKGSDTRNLSKHRTKISHIVTET